MVGSIRRRHILAHMVVTIRSFGWRLFGRALTAGRSQTFLSVLNEEYPCQLTDDEPARIIETCVQMELCAMRIYQKLATHFSAHGKASTFFSTLAGQERDHAQLLGICQTLAQRGRWLDDYVSPWKRTILILERQIHRWEQEIDQFDTMEDALRLVITIEDSEINHVFSTIVTATDSEFVRAIDAFRNASDDHINYICWTMPLIMPSMRTACTDLARKYGLAEKLAA